MSGRESLADAEARSSFRAGDDLAGCTLSRLIAEGATGEVWEARHARTGQKVALRVFSMLAVPGGLAAMEREAALGRVLRHANVVRIHGLKTSGEVAVLVMEMVDGPSLRRVLGVLGKHGLAMPPAAVLEVGLGIARALAFAWDAPGPDGQPLRLVHRDLSPGAVLVSHGGDVRVGGFSIARPADETLAATRMGVLKGNLACMAPERLAGSRRLGPPTDLFSLGVMLWEMGTGRRFHASGRMSSIAQTCRSRSVAEEAESLAGFFPSLALVVEPLLQRDYDQRPSHAGEVAAGLEALLGATPCEGSLARVVDRVEYLDRLDRLSGEARGACPWDSIVRLAGPSAAPARPGSSRGPHAPGLGVCARPEATPADPPAPDRAASSTADWSALSEDEQDSRTADWSTVDPEE